MSKSPKSKKSPNKNVKDKNVLYNDKCSKLEVLLTYNGKTESIFIDNKENISSIRDMVYNIFYPIQGKFQLIYKLKDISPFEDIPLYKYFKNLMKISITVNPINTQNLLVKNDFNAFNNSLQDVTEIDKNEASFGAANQSQLSNAQNPLVEKDRLICNECHNKIISNFCRNCNKFLCKFCCEKYSSPHHDHLYVNINIAQIEKSAKNYKEIVSKECFTSGKRFEEYNRNNTNYTNVNEENNENQNEKKEKIDIDGWLNDMNTKIESLGEIFSKNDEVSANTNLVLQNEENNYDIVLKKLQKINAEKNTKDLETIFNEMHDIDLNIKNIDNNLEKCLHNSENSKTNNKVLKDLNKNLDIIINKLVKSLDLNEKIMKILLIIYKNISINYLLYLKFSVNKFKRIY